MKRKATSQGKRKGNVKRRRVMSNDLFQPTSAYGIEKKFFNSSITQQAVQQGLSVLTGGELNNIAQGDDASNRNGARVLLKSVQVEGFVEVPPQADQTSADASCMVFVALVMDTQTNGAALNTANVYANPSANAALTPLPVRNILFSKRYKVLSVQRLDFDTPNLTYDGTNIELGGAIKHFSMYRKMSLPVQYSAGTGVITSIVDNSLHLVCGTNSVALVPTLSCNTQIRFTDV